MRAIAHRFCARIRQGRTIPRAATWSIGRWTCLASMVQPRKKKSTNHNSKTRIQKMSEAQTWKHNLEVSAIGLGCMGMSYHRGPAPRQECNDSADPQSSGAWRYLFRYRRSLRPVHQRRTCGRSAFPFRKEVVIATKFGSNIENGKVTGPNSWHDLNHAVSKIKLQGDRYPTDHEKQVGH